MAKLFKYNSEDAELFKDVVFLVEATAYERHVLWNDYYNKPKYEIFVRDWKQICMGRVVQIGTCNKRPVCVDISWAILDGKKVMFYYGISQVVDWEMIDKWMRHFSKGIKWDNGTRWAHCDAMNFHHCLDRINEKN